MHSTSSSEIWPSAVTSLWPMPSFFAGMLPQLLAAAQQAADVGADLHVILAQRLAVQHGVVADHFVHLQRSHRTRRATSATSSCGSRADLILRVKQHRDHRRALAALAGNCSSSLANLASSSGEKVIIDHGRRRPDTKSMLPRRRCDRPASDRLRSCAAEPADCRSSASA